MSFPFEVDANIVVETEFFTYQLTPSIELATTPVSPAATNTPPS